MKLLNYLLLLTAVADTADGSAIRTESAEVTTNDGRVRGRRFLSDAIADDEARRGDDDDDDDDDSTTPSPTDPPTNPPTTPPTSPPTNTPTSPPTSSPTSSPTSPPTNDPTFPPPMVFALEDILLIGSNEVAPFTGVPFAAGTAEVQFIFEAGRAGSEWLACIEAKILGFTPQLLHIHNAEIFQNGGVVVDMSPLLGGVPEVSGCIDISEDLFTGILNDPDKFYLNAHVAGAPDALFSQGIRGQLLQKFATVLSTDAVIAPFMGVPGSSGAATVRFENGGNTLCFDVEMTGFAPDFAHIHYSPKGSNGALLIDFSATQVAPSVFFGCLALVELGIEIDLVCEMLADGDQYYFDFHLVPPGTDDPVFLNTIRGQLA